MSDANLGAYLRPSRPKCERCDEPAKYPSGPFPELCGDCWRASSRHQPLPLLAVPVAPIAPVEAKARPVVKAAPVKARPVAKVRPEPAPKPVRPPRIRKPALCRVPECGRPCATRGVCHRCNSRARALGMLDRVRLTAPAEVFVELATRWAEHEAARTRLVNLGGPVLETCRVPGCERPHYVRGLCMACAGRARKVGIYHECAIRGPDEVFDRLVTLWAERVASAPPVDERMAAVRAAKARR